MRIRALAFAAVCLAVILGGVGTGAAQEALPGEPCSVPAGSFHTSAGPEVSGAGYMLVCDGSTWQPVLGYSSADRWIMFGSSGTAAAPLHVWGEAIIGNEGLACATAAEGALRYTSATDTWEFCDGSAWTALTSGGTPGGADRQVQFNNSGSFGGDPNFVFDASGNLALGSGTVSGTLKLDVTGNIGATQYCDENGANCFLATDVGAGGGLWSDSGSGYIQYDSSLGGIRIGDVSGQPAPNIIGVTNLNDLGDVNVPSPAAGEVLLYSGGNWVSGSVSASAAGADREIQFNNSGAFGASNTFKLMADGDLLLTGTHTGTASVPASGAGTRMFFDTQMSAFRAGAVGGTRWDNANIGAYSVAMGEETTASGANSVAIGQFANASGAYSVALGNLTGASGTGSVALGADSAATAGPQATGNHSVALGGSGSTSIGQFSMSMGSDARAKGNYSVAMGGTTTAAGDYSFAIGNQVNITATGDASVAFGLTTTSPITDPQISGAQSFGIFMGDQSGYDLSSANTMALVGIADLVLDEDGSTAASKGCLRFNDTTDKLQFSHDCATYTDMDGGLWTAGAGDDIYYNSGTPQVGIGTASPTTNLHLYDTGSSAPRVNLDHGTNVAATWSGYEFRADGTFKGGMYLLHSDDTLGVFTAGDVANPRLAITSAGNVGIGTADPTYPLTVQGPEPTMAIRATAAGSSARMRLDFMDSGDVVLGRAGIGAANRLDVASLNGDLRLWAGTHTCDLTYNGSGALSCSSDARLKQNIKPLENVLEKVMRLEGVSYELKSSPGMAWVGLIAQNVQKEFPELVSEDNDGYLRLDHASLVAPLIESVKTLKTINDRQDATIKSCEAKIELLTESHEHLLNEVKGLKAHTGYGVNRAEMGIWILALTFCLSSVFFLIGGVLRYRSPKTE